MNSPKKRKGISTKTETEKTKQKRIVQTNDLLGKYFLEEEFKMKFGAAFRFVKQLNLNVVYNNLTDLSIKYSGTENS